MAPRTLLVTDEGLNGLDFEAVNEGAKPLHADLEVVLYRHGEVPVATGRTALDLAPQGRAVKRSAELFEHFLDVTYAYRFGPPMHDLTVARLKDRDTGAVISEAWHLPQPLPSARRADLGLTATAALLADGTASLTLATRAAAFAVALQVPGWRAQDDFINVAPGATVAVKLVPIKPGATLKGSVLALNGTAPVKITIHPAGGS
jgi:beta-mannosidase